MANSDRKTVTPDKVRQIVSSFFSREKTNDHSNRDDKDEKNKETTRTDSSTKASLEHRSKEAYFKRVKTFTPLKWFSKPIELSPLVCAQYGWENVDDDTLQCVGCKMSFTAKLPTVDDPTFKEECETLKDSLMSRHLKTCSWSSNPSSDSYKQIPHYDQKEVRKDFRERLAQLKKIISNLPDLNYETFEKWNVSSSRCSQLAYQIEKSDTSSVKTAVAMALTGWSHSDMADVIMCSHCQRHVGLWNFRPWSTYNQESDDKDGEESSPKRARMESPAKSSFDPVEEHRFWCPWITLNSEPLGSAETSTACNKPDSLSASLEENSAGAGCPGWLLVLKILAPRLLDSSNISFSKSLKQSSVTVGLRSIRHLFNDWTTATSTDL